jgi:uncharacterized protein YbaR (Trm112 family)
MLQSQMIAIFRCPDDRSELSAASDELVKQLNQAIRAGRLVDRAGKQVEQTINGGLIRADGTMLYKIVDEIPILLQDEAIPLTQLGQSE